MADEIYKALCPTSEREDKFVKSKNRQRNDLHKYIVILQRLDDVTAKLSSSTSTKSSASEMKNISTILFSNLHGIRVLDRSPNERVTTTSEHLIINDLKYSKKCVNYIQESAQINSFIDFLQIILSIKECKNEIPKEIQKLKILNLCLKWWLNVISQIITYTSVEKLASDFIDVMEILQWFLKFDYLPTISFNKILAKHSLNEIVLTDVERDLYSVMDYYYTANDFDAFDSIFDKPFFSMLKFNHLFSGLPVGRCSKTIAIDFIKDNITTMEYLINPSEKNFENAIDQLKNRKYNEVNPYIQKLLKDCTINSRDTYVKCLTFRKWVIEQRRETIKEFCKTLKKVYEEHCLSFVESVPSPISLNSDNICNDIAELKNVATSSSVVKFEEKETQTCQSYVDQTTQTEHIIFEEYYQNNDIESNEEEMEIDDSGNSDIQTCQITTKPSISKRIFRKSIRIKEKIAAKNASNKKEGKIVAKTLEHYFECAAKIPNFQDETEAADDSDRDECVSTPEDFKLLLKCKIGDKIVPNSSNLLTDEVLRKCKIHQYFSACGTKFNGDTDSALVHLSANGYSIKKTLESIDNPDSIPMKRIHENLGIWRENEMDAFAKCMSNNYKWNNKCKKITKHPFWIKQFQKMFPKKSPRNCSNFYYTLKSAGFSFKDEGVYGILKSLPKKECLNCVKQLWKSQSEEQHVSNLCGLCKLYFELYEKQRPNAKALPLHFNLSPKRI